MKIEKRDVAVAIILSLVTCGIYNIYWYIKLTDEVGEITGKMSFSGGICFLLTLVTCGLFNIYWAYAIGKAMYEKRKSNGEDVSDNSILYLILAIFGLSLIVEAIAQDDVNKYVEAQG